MKPMLAARLRGDPRLPAVASFKLDGVRALVVDGVLVSRNLKPIKNERLQEKFGRPEYNGWDGELVDGTGPEAWNRSVSAVMRSDGPLVSFQVFDNFRASGGFLDRLATIPEPYRVLHWTIRTSKDLAKGYERALFQGYEGIMLRDPDGAYKFGRSTLREFGLVKMKPSPDAEARVVGVLPLLRNQNPMKRDKLGRARRSNQKDGMIADDTLGSLEVEGVTAFRGVKFSIGSGFTDELRRDLWNNPPIGRLAKFKYQPADYPRFPVFMGFRDED